MKAEVYWVDGGPGPGRLAIMPRPRGGSWLDDEMASLRTQGVDVLVSMLLDGEARRLDLADEPEAARQAGMEFVSFPVEDMTVPADDAGMLDLAERIRGWVAAGKGVAVHCFGGIGRSGMLLACVLLKMGRTSAEAVRLLTDARGFIVPQTDEQAEWIERIGREMRQ